MRNASCQGVVTDRDRNNELAQAFDGGLILSKVSRDMGFKRHTNLMLVPDMNKTQAGEPGLSLQDQNPFTPVMSGNW